MEKKKVLQVFAVVAAMFFLGACVQDKYVCGSKGQHKKRSANMKKMAPTMSR